MSDSTENPDEAGRLTGPSRRAALAPVLASIAFVLELTLVPLLLPFIQQQFDLSISQLGWIFNSYGLAVAVGVLLGGWFGDAYGTRALFAFGAICFALGAFFAALAGSFEQLILGRALQGLGGGIFSPLVPLLLTRASPDRPGWILIVLGSVTGYIAAIAPLVYGPFLNGDNWGLAFIFMGCLTAGAALIVLGARLKKRPEREPAVQKRYSALFRASKLWVLFGYVFCTYGAITYYLFRLPIWLTDHEFTAVSVGFVISSIWLSFATFSTVLRNRVDKPQIQKIMLAAPCLIAAGVLLTFNGETLLSIVLASIFVGSGLACSNAPSTQLILKFAPEGFSAISTSLDITFARLGGVATVAILAPAGFVFAISALSVLCAAAFVCGLIATRGHVAPQAA